MTLIRVTAPHFVASVVLDDKDICVRWAPILHYCAGKSRVWIVRYMRGKHWEVEILSDLPLDPPTPHDTA